MSHRVTLAPVAVRQLRKLDPQARRRIQAALELLATDPRPPATRLVGGSLEWRVRTGDYRVVYEINDEELLILVVRVAHRRDVYKAREPRAHERVSHPDVRGSSPRTSSWTGHRFHPQGGHEHHVTCCT